MACVAGLVMLRMNQPELRGLPDFEKASPSLVSLLKPDSTPEPSAPAVPSSIGTAVETAVSTPEPTPEPTPTPTPMPTPELFTISVIGDQTLASAPQFRDSAVGYIARMNGDYSYPFHNTAEFFLNDDFTISNLECTFTDKTLYSAQQFSFRAPTDYAQILIEGGVDFVTTANNHMMDFGQEGLDDTYAALEAYGIPYGKEDDANLYTTPSGLTIGIYSAYNSYQPSKDKAAAAIRNLREQGAEYVICAFHWGQELYYQPNAFQIELGHACIDAGADLIFGSHTHCLQPIEQYNGGIILYSMGNWSFGGSTAPTDKDTAIVQITLMRDLDGTLSVAALKRIPCCVSSRPVKEGYTGDNYNDYVPTPYTEDSDAYNRVLSKLNGSYEAKSQGADYSNWYATWG
ncbi:MAG: CapA family protein [Eubacteriales bacterium]|nr:CapA family protein [Eubacteriales bacterium]